LWTRRHRTDPRSIRIVEVESPPPPQASNEEIMKHVLRRYSD
jgi:hypothetical protein